MHEPTPVWVQCCVCLTYIYAAVASNPGGRSSGDDGDDDGAVLAGVLVSVLLVVLVVVVILITATVYMLKRSR